MKALWVRNAWSAFKTTDSTGGESQHPVTCGASVCETPLNTENEPLKFCLAQKGLIFEYSLLWKTLIMGTKGETGTAAKTGLQGLCAWLDHEGPACHVGEGRGVEGWKKRRRKKERSVGEGRNRREVGRKRKGKGGREGNGKRRDIKRGKDALWQDMTAPTPRSNNVPFLQSTSQEHAPT